MRWNSRTAIIGVVCGALVAAAGPGAVAAATSHANKSGVQIRRTEYGIPHILASNYSDLGFGYGYAFAQDNACEMADRVLTLRGERSQFLGPNATTNDSLGGPTSNLDSDAFFQARRQAGTVEQLLSRPAPLGPTPKLRKLVDGYADGFNRYLHDIGGAANLTDPTCKGKPWVQPITAEDVWSNILDIDQAGGQNAVRRLIAEAAPPAAGPATAGTAPAAITATKAAQAAQAALAGPLSALTSANTVSSGLGSNGWALGADATADHDSMVLINPHLPWTGDSRFYQVQLTIPGQLDVSGAALYGTPVVEIGHTAGLAWTATHAYSAHMSLYQLTLVPGDPTSYLVDGKPEKMQTQQVPVQVLGTDGKVTTVVKTLYNSRYGPMLATGWTAGTAITARDANADNIRSVNQWLAMDQAQNLDQLRAAQRMYQGMPWNYNMATDTSGTTYFTDSSAVPHLTDAQLATCTLAPKPHLPTLLDGSKTSCDWGSDLDAIEPGLFGPSHQPALTRRDFVANSNNNPWLTNPAAPLTGYPSVYGADPSLALRPQQGLSMIAGRIAGTDGLGPAGFTLPTLQQLMFDDTDRSATLGLADVVATCRAHPSMTAGDGSVVDVRKACDVLAGWDGRGGVNSHGEPLWQQFLVHLYIGFTANFWRTPYDPAHPLTTPAGINSADPDVQTALADVVELDAKAGTPLDASPGQVQRWDDVPLHGCSNPEGCFNVVAAQPTSGQNGGVDAQAHNAAHGSSFIMAVELTPTGPQARSVVTYSESSNPASPHYTDQTQLFSHSQWVTDRFSEADIAASPALQVTTLRR